MVDHFQQIGESYENLETINGGPDVRALIAKPQGNSPFPAATMIHEFFGLNKRSVGKAIGLAKIGYLVVAPDTFRGSTTAWISCAIHQEVTTMPEQVLESLPGPVPGIFGGKDSSIPAEDVRAFKPALDLA